MGIFPSLWQIWLYTIIFAIIALVSLVGIFMFDRRWIKGIWAGCCLIAVLVLTGGYLTGFTFHLNTAAPVSSDRLVYVFPPCLCRPDSGLQTELIAVRVRDGHVQWRHPAVSNGLIGIAQFVSDGQRVYLLEPSLNASDGGHILIALDAQTGRQIWQVSHVGGRLVGEANGHVTIDSGGTTLILDAATGTRLVRLPVGNAILERDGAVYACSSSDGSSTTTAIDEVTGRTLWTSPPAFGCGRDLTPDLLLGGGNGILTVIRAKDGSLVWQVSQGEGPSDVLVAGNTLFTSVQPASDASANAVVSARSVSDGSLLWQKTPRTSPILYQAADNVVLLADSASDSPLLALRGSDGKPLWSFPQANGSPTVGAIADGVVILNQASSRQIMALDLHTGALYWQTSI